MKFIHLSDLHIGKRVNDISMLEDQEYILSEIIRIIDCEKPSAVLICGDVYDKSMPSGEAVALFDEFICKLAKRNIEVLIISGNHDSPERIAFGGRIMEKSGIHLSPVYNGTVFPITLSDEHGKINFYLLPFIKPAHVRRFFPEENIESYTDACRVAVEKMEVNKNERNVILTHQFVTGAATCESEELSVGGTDNVDSSIFEDFDYVALGHLHGPQNIGSNRIRYCGTPLKYSFSEEKHFKSVTVAELGKKGSLEIRTVPLVPKRDLKKINGSFEEITNKDFYSRIETNDYFQITLTDEEDIPEAIGRLRVIYPNIMKLGYDNTRTRKNQIVDKAENIKRKSPIELFEELYEKQNNQSMSDEQRAFSLQLIESIWEDNL
ncbi:MAG: exonuclease SbcCD subunit D [Oscillospiraceae bacterium]|nr:exonuclease SbcCD subunit D [Oscillospiraceae bacterium]